MAAPAELPRNVPFVDLLLPPGVAEAAGDLQTRLDLVGGGAWRVRPDDGTFEQSSLPMQPLRGAADRMQVWRQLPLRPGESFQEPASLAVELAFSTQAHAAALGVYGAYSWALVLAEDLRWLHGLILLDWLYNPRIDEKGELMEGNPDAAASERTLSAKVRLWPRLATPERAQQMARRLPQGALQQVEGYLTLSLLGPEGGFDPRYWQGFAMQLALADVRGLAQQEAGGKGAGPGAAAAGSGAQAPGGTPGSSRGGLTPGGPGGGARSPGPVAAPAAPAPSDGLTALARAMKDAEKRAAEPAATATGAASSAHAAAPEAASGPPLRWLSGPRGPVLWVPPERMEAAAIKALRDGNVDTLGKRERPDAATLETWLSAGAPFLSEVELLSKLFLENVPVHKGKFEEASTEQDGYRVLDCHLPRVAPVRALLLPAEGERKRRILVSSDTALKPADMLALAP